MFGRRLVSVALVGATLSACSSTEHRITIDGIAQRTLDAKSARIEGTSGPDDPRIRAVVRMIGVARFDPETYSFTAESPDIGTLEAEVFTHQGFIRQRSRGKGQIPLVSSGWCKQGGGIAENGFGFNPTSVLASLRGGGGTLERLGTGRIRGVDTTRYRVVRTGLPSTEVWVDSNDLLRRIQQTHDGETEVLDYFDYGVATTPITVPAHASPCSP